MTITTLGTPEIQGLISEMSRSYDTVLQKYSPSELVNIAKDMLLNMDREHTPSTEAAERMIALLQILLIKKDKHDDIIIDAETISAINHILNAYTNGFQAGLNDGQLSGDMTDNVCQDNARWLGYQCGVANREERSNL